jgi:hypothetical protein
MVAIEIDAYMRAKQHDITNCVMPMQIDFKLWYEEENKGSEKEQLSLKWEQKKIVCSFLIFGNGRQTGLREGRGDNK